MILRIQISQSETPPESGEEAIDYKMYQNYTRITR